MSRENEIRMQTLKDFNENYSSSGENLDPELYQLQVQLAAIEEHQHLQMMMIKQFQQQLKMYQEKFRLNNLSSKEFLSKIKKSSPDIENDHLDMDDENGEQKELIISNDDHPGSVSSPLDLSTSDHLSSTSIKSDEEQQISSSIQFQMEEHEGEPEDPNMAKLKDMIDQLERTTKKNDSNECVVCKRVLSCQSALKMHYRTHTGERPFRCRICARAFSTKGNLKTHMNVHRLTGEDQGSNKAHRCSICQKQMNNVEQFRSHLRSHLNDPTSATLAEDALKSLDSDRSLSSADEDSHVDYLRRETSSIKRESSEDDDESKSSPMSNSLAAAIAAAAAAAASSNSHLSPFHIFNSQFFPNLAANTFPFLAAAAALNTNSNSFHLTNTDEQQDQQQGEDLSQTSKMFADEATIHNEKSQLRRSSSISQHVCSICSKNFSSASALQIHNRTHTGEKPYKCEICGRAFTTKGNLKVHTGTHMYHAQTSPTMVAGTTGAAIIRQRRRYDYHPYSIPVKDLERSMKTSASSSPSSSNTIKSES